MSDFIEKYSDLKNVSNHGISDMFHAFDHALNRSIMIKRLHLDPDDTALSLKQFQNEIHYFSQIQHPNIIRIIDYGNDESNFYIVTEYIDGFDLNTMMSEVNFNRDVYLMIVFKALIALGYSHECGLVHGNIKPSNIIIDKNGRVVLTDFCTSQIKKYAFTPENCKKDLTTKYFIAPEQVNSAAQQAGLIYDECDENNSFIYNKFSSEQPCVLSRKGLQYDLWSAGVLLYRLCMGCYPFHDSGLPELLSSITNINIRNNNEFLPNLPYHVSALIYQCLEKNPEKRPGSVYMVTNALQNYFYMRGIIDIDEALFGYMYNIAVLNQINQKYEPSILKSAKSSQIAAEHLNTIVNTENELTQYEPSLGEQFSDIDVSWRASVASIAAKFMKPVLVFTILIAMVATGVLLNKTQLRKYFGGTSVDFEYKHIPLVKTEIQTLNPATLQSEDSEIVKVSGQLNVYSYPTANLYIDDEQIGTAPTPSPILLAEGRHKVVLVLDGYQTHKEYVNIVNGVVSRLKIQLKKTE